MSKAITKIGYGSKHTNTLNTTIPAVIRDRLELEKGGQILWNMEEAADGTVTVSISKI